MAGAPRGFDSGGGGTITCRSGCCREGLPRSSAAKASAVVIRPAPEGPMKAYAWATRSLASARRKSSTARGWSAMRSSATKPSGAPRSGATEEVLDDRAHLGLDLGGRAGRAGGPHAPGRPPVGLGGAAAAPPGERQRLPARGVEVAPPDAPQSLRGIEIEEQREVREDPAGRPHVQLADEVRIDTAAVALVGDGRVGVPVAEDDAATREPRPNLLRDVLLAGGHEQEDLDERLRLDAGALEQAAHGESEPRSVGLTGALNLPPVLTKPSLEAHHLGRLARPLDALERDQDSAHAPDHSTTPPHPRPARGPGGLPAWRRGRAGAARAGRVVVSPPPRPGRRPRPPH